MRLLGVDPGLSVTGYGLIEIRNGQGSGGKDFSPITCPRSDSQPARRGGHLSPILIEAGLIRTKGKDSLSDRLATVARELQALLVQHQPDLMVVEDLYSHYKRPKTAILMGHVRGVILSQAALKHIPVASYLPTRIKKAVVGNGHAPKLQLARMVRMRLNISHREIPADVSDALATALCYADQMRCFR